MVKYIVPPLTVCHKYNIKILRTHIIGDVTCVVAKVFLHNPIDSDGVSVLSVNTFPEICVIECPLVGGGWREGTDVTHQ